MKKLLAFLILLTAFTSPSAAEVEIKPLWYVDFEKEISDVAFSTDGRYIVVGVGREVRLYDNRGNLLWTKKVAGTQPKVKISRNGEYIAVTTSFIYDLYLYSSSGELLFWKRFKLPYMKGLFYITAPDGNVTVAAYSNIYSKNGTRIGSYCRLYTSDAYRYFCRIPSDLFSISEDAKNYVGCDGNDVISKIEDKHKKDRVERYTLYSSCTTISISPDGRYYVVGTRSGDVYFFEYPAVLLKRYTTKGRVHRVLIVNEGEDNSSYKVVVLNREGYLHFFDEKGNLKEKYPSIYSDALISSVGSYVSIPSTWRNTRLEYYETAAVKAASEDKNPEVTLVANSIDYALASDFVEFLRGLNVGVVSANASTDFRSRDFIVILGGPAAYEGVGDVVREVLTEEEQNSLLAEGQSRMFIKEDVWRANQKVLVLSGSDRYMTRRAWMDHRSEVADLITDWWQG